MMRVVFAGGGTGGHIIPAIAISEELKTIDSESEILFIGSNNSLEKEIFSKRADKFYPISTQGYHRGEIKRNLLFPLWLIKGFIEAFIQLIEFKPKVVVGTGGFVSGPPVLAAKLLGIPTLIQEQNGYPGITTRILSKFVTEVHLGLKDAEKYLKRKENIFITGNPVKKSLFQPVENPYAIFNLKKDFFTVFIFGGSQGAQKLNQQVPDLIRKLYDKNIQILWVTGNELYTKYYKNTVITEKATFVIKPFIYEMNAAYQVSNLIVSRAGAITIAEITALGKPGILIPLPTSAGGHQLANARFLEKAGAAILINNEDLNAEFLADIILRLKNDEETYNKMCESSKKIGNRNSSSEIAERIYKLGMKSN